eukprot:gene737-912_t
MNLIKKLANETAIYGLSSIIGRVLNYLLVPLYTSCLLPEAYGTVTEMYAYIAFLNILYGYGMETAYFRFATQKNPVETFNIAHSFLILTSCLFSGLLVCFAPSISSWLGYKGHISYIYYIAAIVGVDNLLLLPFSWLRFNNHALLFAQAKCLQIGLNIAFNLLLLYLLPAIAEGQFLSSYAPFVQRIYHPAHHVAYIFAANLTANVAVFPLLLQPLATFRFSIQWHKIKPMVLYALPLLVMGLAGTTNEMLSRALLKQLLPANFYPTQSNEAAVGIFGACYKLAILVALATQAFRYAADPFFFSHAKDKHADQLFSKIMYGYVLVACFIWFATSANIELLGALFLRNSVYRTGLEIVPYLCGAYVWLGIYYNLSVWFKLANKTYYGSFITLFGAVITIVLNFILVPYWGYWGSVWATLISHFAMTTVCYYQGQRYHPIPYPTGRILLVMGITFLSILLVQQIPYPTWHARVVGNIGWTLLFSLTTFIAIKRSLKLPNE